MQAEGLDVDGPGCALFLVSAEVAGGHMPVVTDSSSCHWRSVLLVGIDRRFCQ